MRFLKRCENLAFCDIEDMDPGDCSCTRTFTVFAEEAISATYDACKKTKGMPDPAKIKMLRTFRWVFDPDENEQVEEWQRIAVMTARDRLTAQRAQALNRETSSSQSTTTRTSAASSFSTQNLCPPPLADTAPTKKKDAARPTQSLEWHRVTDEEPCVAASGLISFFGSKAM